MGLCWRRWDVIADYIDVDLKTQRLHLFAAGQVVFSCLISSGKNGVGEQFGSGQTPRGWFRVRVKIGAGAALNSVFVGRRLTGEVYSRELARAFPDRDWILTRILWLTGVESGRNRGGDVDTLRRYIYLHGCPDACAMGVPLSHGCIRLRNRDMVDLFDRIEAGIRLKISA